MRIVLRQELGTLQYSLFENLPVQLASTYGYSMRWYC